MTSHEGVTRSKSCVDVSQSRRKSREKGEGKKKEKEGILFNSSINCRGIATNTCFILEKFEGIP
jgi:hypothetical protein